MKTATTLLIVIALVAVYLLSPPIVVKAFYTADPKGAKYPAARPIFAHFHIPAWYLAENNLTYADYVSTPYVLLSNYRGSRSRP